MFGALVTQWQRPSPHPLGQRLHKPVEQDLDIELTATGSCRDTSSQELSTRFAAPKGPLATVELMRLATLGPRLVVLTLHLVLWISAVALPFGRLLCLSI